MNLNDLQEWKCKRCGEPLPIENARNGIVKCNYCNSSCTLPKTDADQKVLSFLNLGEHDLDTGKFEDAFSAYSKASELDKTEPEAYWGMALAKFGVRYIKDTVNNRLQPICYNITDKNFEDNDYFLKALTYSGEEQKKIYQANAIEIDDIKNKFYDLQQSGKDYDCFICVKVSDEKGDKTADYKTADDIYFELKGKGYKPFFSERELINATGSDYEAHILYALATSETMLVICSDENYLQTPWVKNEYSRYLKLVNDEEKESDSIAIVFNNKPIEKLPGKNGKLQGIDINSLNAIERIITFIETHSPEAKKRREKENATANGNIENILKRAFDCAEDGNFKKANDYAEEALLINPECAEAYSVKLLCDIKKKNLDELQWMGKSLNKNLNYQRAVKYADEELKEQLERRNVISNKIANISIFIFIFILAVLEAIIGVPLCFNPYGINYLDYIFAVIDCVVISCLFISILIVGKKLSYCNNKKKYKKYGIFLLCFTLPCIIEKGDVEEKGYKYSACLIPFIISASFTIISNILGAVIKIKNSTFLGIWLSVCSLIWGTIFICGCFRNYYNKIGAIYLILNILVLGTLIASIICFCVDRGGFIF